MLKVKNALFLIFCAMVVWAAENQPHIAHGVVTHQDLFNTEMRPGVSCYRIPALVTAPNGDLVAAIDERVESCGDLNANRDINIVLRRSRDNGLTWSDMETVVDYPPGRSASDPSMIVDRETGSIHLFYNYMNVDEEPGIYEQHVLKSSDNGQTWSQPSDITPHITKPGWRSDFKFLTSGGGIQTRSGLFLHTLVNLKRGLFVIASRDFGESWFLIHTPLSPGDESKIVELVDGRWMVNSRVNQSGLRYVHTSTDSGTTWKTMPEPKLVDPGCNADFIRYTSITDGYDKNRLLFCNANHVETRKNLTVRLSYDEGQTWSDGKTIYSGSSAYSSLTILQNGDIGLLFEKDNYAENVFVRFSLEWLTNGEDKYKRPTAE